MRERCEKREKRSNTIVFKIDLAKIKDKKKKSSEKSKL